MIDLRTMLSHRLRPYKEKIQELVPDATDYQIYLFMQRGSGKLGKEIMEAALSLLEIQADGKPSKKPMQERLERFVGKPKVPDYVIKDIKKRNKWK